MVFFLERAKCVLFVVCSFRWFLFFFWGGLLVHVVVVFTCFFFGEGGERVLLVLFETIKKGYPGKQQTVSFGDAVAFWVSCWFLLKPPTRAALKTWTSKFWIGTVPSVKIQTTFGGTPAPLPNGFMHPGSAVQKFGTAYLLHPLFGGQHVAISKDESDLGGSQPSGSLAF